MRECQSDTSTVIKVESLKLTYVIYFNISTKHNGKIITFLAKAAMCVILLKLHGLFIEGYPVKIK